MRESFFTCRFTSPARSRTAHIRAWDEKEAAQLFGLELSQDEEGREPGLIEVFRAKRRILETRYEPNGWSSRGASASM